MAKKNHRRKPQRAAPTSPSAANDRARFNSPTAVAVDPEIASGGVVTPLLLPTSPVARNSLLWKLAVAIGIVLLTQAALWGIRQEFVLTTASVADLDLNSWPLKLPGWQGERTSLDADVVRHSGADAMGTWLYRNRLGEQVLAHAGIWTKYEYALPHSPELCYTGSGYRLIDSRELTVTAPNRTPAKARLYRFERNHQPLMVLAWYQFGNETLLDRNDLRGLMQRVRSGSGVLPPAIKVMLQCRADDPARAEDRLLEVAGLLRTEAGPLQSQSSLATD